MASLMETLKRIAERHDERMKTDQRYAMTVAYMQQASEPVERIRHYDRDGYCDSPYRGY